MLPKGLYKRSLLIVILPMVLLQTAVTFAFMQHHFELVTRRLSESVARDVGALADLYRELPPGADDAYLANLAAERFRMDATLLPRGPLPPTMPRSFFSALDPLTRTLPSELKNQVQQPFWVDTIGRSGLMEIRVDLGDRVLRLVTRRALAYEANAHIFVLVDARGDAGPVDGRDHLSAQPDPADPAARARGRGFRQGTRHRLQSARRA